MSRIEYYNGVLDRIKIIVDGLETYRLEINNKEDTQKLKEVLLKCPIIRENVAIAVFMLT